MLNFILRREEEVGTMEKIYNSCRVKNKNHMELELFDFLKSFVLETLNECSKSSSTN